MKKPSYFNHLWANWRVAAHALSDFAEHFLHGLLPCISWRHGHEPEKSLKGAVDHEAN